MRRLVATLVLAAATGALLAGTALAQPGSSESEDAPPAEAAAPCYAAPAEADRGTVTLVAHEACDASEAEAQGGDAPAAADDAAVTKRVGPLGILP